ncbi:P-loop containing nucleoside triphosphate hydrolase protein, partial [Ephemerocybe angulata]
VTSDDISTTFSDVFVDEATVDSLQTIVTLPLLYPDYFNCGVLAKEAIGGILLYGPPGTGKTMLCRALAKTSHAKMLHIQPSDINDKYLGESEKKVAAVFELAYKLAPCIVFIDELDALFSSRSCNTESWEKNILTEFMQGMDGLKSAKKNRDNNIVIVGATNRPFDLDLAILRRMPRRILVGMPDLTMRKGILASYLKGEELHTDVSIDKLAMDTEGFSGSDLKSKLFTVRTSTANTD